MRSDGETRERLLTEARRLFAENGFRRTTVREICRAAGANVAAVNYHFRDKDGLYREVIQDAVRAMQDTTELARREGEGRAPEEKLRVYVSTFLRRVLSPQSRSIHRLVLRETTEPHPTPGMDAIVEQGLRPRLEYLSSLVAEILGCPADDPRVRPCVASIQGQFLAYMRSAIAERVGFKVDVTSAGIEAAAHHISEFSLGGLRAVKRARG